MYTKMSELRTIIFSVQNRIHTSCRLPQFFAIECKRDRVGKGLGLSVSVRVCERESLRPNQSKIIGLVYDRSYLI